MPVHLSISAGRDLRAGGGPVQAGRGDRLRRPPGTGRTRGREEQGGVMMTLKQTGIKSAKLSSTKSVTNHIIAPARVLFLNLLS